MPERVNEDAAHAINADDPFGHRLISMFIEIVVGRGEFAHWLEGDGLYGCDNHFHMSAREAADMLLYHLKAGYVDRLALPLSQNCLSTIISRDGLQSVRDLLYEPLVGEWYRRLPQRGSLAPDSSCHIRVSRHDLWDFWSLFLEDAFSPGQNDSMNAARRLIGPRLVLSSTSLAIHSVPGFGPCEIPRFLLTL